MLATSGWPHHRSMAQQAEAMAAPTNSFPLRQLNLCCIVCVLKSHMVVIAKAACPWTRMLEAAVATWAWVWLSRLCLCKTPVAQCPRKTETTLSEGAGQAMTAENPGCYHYECTRGARLRLDCGRCHPTNIERRWRVHPQLIRQQASWL